MFRHALALLFGASILTPLSGIYAMLLAYIFIAAISYKDVIAVIIILYAAYKIKVMSKNGKG